MSSKMHFERFQSNSITKFTGKIEAYSIEQHDLKRKHASRMGLLQIERFAIIAKSTKRNLATDATEYYLVPTLSNAAFNA